MPQPQLTGHTQPTSCCLRPQSRSAASELLLGSFHCEQCTLPAPSSPVRSNCKRGPGARRRGGGGTGKPRRLSGKNVHAREGSASDGPTHRGCGATTAVGTHRYTQRPCVSTTEARGGPGTWRPPAPEGKLLRTAVAANMGCARGWVCVCVWASTGMYIPVRCPRRRLQWPTR
jgi:hypothetical protein